VPEAVSVIYESGLGRVQEVALKTDSHFAILLRSESLVESLAEADCEEKDKNAIVARIAKITITTINSTRVNQVVFRT
jgi:predicted glycosyltransferase